MAMNRRDMLTLMASATAGVPFFLRASGRESEVDGLSVFQHGVASGDPDHISVVLWTRVTTTESKAQVRWQIALDESFNAIAMQGSVSTSASRDYTIKVVPDKLIPGTTYFYRFQYGARYSTIGKTKTLTQGKLERLGVALVSCSNFPFGYFNAYDAIARDSKVDIVFHAGDYIYEYGADGWGSQTGRELQRLHEPSNEIISLEDYRRRHAQYKTDKGAQNMHASHPFVACWDDHESANNAWVDGAQNHQPDIEGEWLDRQKASLQAYYEWMPIREPQRGQSRADYMRSYQFGDLATLTLLETRHSAREEEQGPWAYKDMLRQPGGRNRFMREVLGAPSRRMMSEDMAKFAVDSISDSVKQKQPWRLVGSASPMARLLLPNIIEHGLFADNLPKASEYMGEYGRLNLPWYTDTWDGYASARQSFYRSCQQVGAQDLLVLSGDSHSFMTNTLFDDEGKAMGIELSTGGVTSPSEFVAAGWHQDKIEQFDRLFAQHENEVSWFNSLHQGYTRIELSRKQGLSTFVGVDTITSPKYKTIEFQQKRLVKSGNKLTLGS
ncbi:alkaline phosphatase [Alteromonadaceae bacterium M269]|nr:alkaline phosphatase [Alteromonadaceae bacterium M269]